MLPVWFLNFSFFVFVVFCALGAPGMARAAMTIDVCGHSLLQCAENEKIGASVGRSTVECDPVTSDCQVKKNDIMLNPKTPLDTPSGWTAPVPPSVEPTPPSTTTRDFQGTPEYTGPNSTAQQICDGIPAATPYHVTSPPQFLYHNAGSAIEVNGTFGLTWGFVGNCTVGGVSHSVRIATAGCPSGYTLGSGTCNLNNAAAVIKPSDGKCTIKRDGNSFTGDSRDPDCSVNPGVSISGSTVTISPKPTGSENVRYSFTPDGGGTVSHSVPGTDGTTTQRTVQFGAPDGAGDSLVTGTREAKFTGTGSLQNPNAQGDMPTDYNRETTQQGILAELKKDRKIDETGTPSDASLKGASDAFDAEASSRQSALEGVGNVTNLGLGLSITWPVASCEDPTFAMPGTSHSLTVPMCAARPNLQAGLNWLVAVLTAFQIFTIGTSGVRS